jgi:glycerol-3-phosphate acyltransferase PlsY
LPVETIGWTHLAVAAAGYLLGSIPFGLILTHLNGDGDLRAIGSGNIGATNVLRTGHKNLAAMTLLLDGGKGAAAVFICAPWGAEAGLAAGLAAVLGHNFPLWLRFKGGKGVATTLGVLLAAVWPAGVGACLTWIGVAALLRYSSMAALAALIAAPFYAYWLAEGHAAGLAAVLAVLAIIRHHANIGRLLRGEEPKIGNRSGTKSSSGPVAPPPPR